MLDASLRALAATLDGLPSGSVLEGRVHAPRAALVVDGRTLDPRKAKDLRALVRAGTPAVFGEGTTTRHDPRVRSGLQLDASRVALASVDLDAVLAEIAERLLGASSATLPTCRLHGVQLYREGDAFVAHRDTPRGEQHLGTLVLALPSPFEGGELVTSVPWFESMAWGAALAHAPDHLPWAAFFGDVPHEVLPVRRGTRVTVSFELDAPARPSAEAPALDASLEADPALVERLAAVLREHDGWHLDGDRRGAVTRRIAVPCTHLYGVARARTGPRPIDRLALATLKGRDQGLARAALALGLEVELVPAVGVDEGADPRDSASVIGAWTSTPGPSRLARIAASAELGPDDLDALLGRDWDALVPVRADAIHRHEFLRCSWSGTGYFGNEASEAALYTLAVLVVTLPASRQRGVVGRRVEHPRFGPGVVEALQSEGPDSFARVRFEDGSTRTLLASKLGLA